MYRFNVLLKKDLTSIFRTKKFLIILLVLISFAVLSPVSAKAVGLLVNFVGDKLGGQVQELSELSKMLGGSSYVDSYAQFAGNLAEMFIFILIILFGSAIVKEKVKGTYHVLKMNGVKDREFVMSHVLSQVIAVSVAYVISCLFFLLATFVLFGRALPRNALYSLFSLYLLLIFFVILINFISCYAKSNTYSMVVNFSTYFGIVLMNIIPKVKYFLPFSLNDNTISVLNGQITLENNVSIISTIVWCCIMIAIMMIFNKNKVKND